MAPLSMPGLIDFRSVKIPANKLHNFRTRQITFMNTKISPTTNLTNRSPLLNFVQKPGVRSIDRDGKQDRTPVDSSERVAKLSIGKREKNMTPDVRSRSRSPRTKRKIDLAAYIECLRELRQQCKTPAEVAFRLTGPTLKEGFMPKVKPSA